METNTRKAVVHGKDIALAYALGGLEKVQALHDDRGLSVVALESARDILTEQEETDGAAQLAALQADLFPDAHGQRGRAAPTVGSARSYRVQIDGNGEAFAKVPLGAFGYSKADGPQGARKSVTVRFEQGRAIVLAE